MRKSFFWIILACFFVSWVAFSWFWSTNLSFFDGTTTGKALNMDFAVWTRSGFDVIISNPGLETEYLTLDFVSQIKTAEGIDSCDMISGHSYGDMLLRSGDLITLAPGEEVQKYVQFTFDACTNWVFLGCAVQLTPSVVDIGSFDVMHWKANLISLTVSPGDACSSYKVIARPAFRTDNWYAFSGADFWLLVQTWWVWTPLYSSLSWDSALDFDRNGYAQFNMIRPALWTEYMVVLKPKWALAVWYTWIWDATTWEFNMFSGNFANMISDRFVFKQFSDAVTWNYLRMWDVVDQTSFVYDIITDSDFAEISNNLTLGTNTIPQFWYDFDVNGVVSAMEQSMLLQSYNKYGYISWLDLQGIVPMSVFVGF
jgi:hypothetical protein